MVPLLGAAGADQRTVIVEDRLGEAGSAGGEIDGGVVGFLQRNRRGRGRAVAGELDAILCIIGGVLAHEKEHFYHGDAV